MSSMWLSQHWQNEGQSPHRRSPARLREQRLGNLPAVQLSHHWSYFGPHLELSLFLNCFQIQRWMGLKLRLFNANDGVLVGCCWEGTKISWRTVGGYWVGRSLKPPLWPGASHGCTLTVLSFPASSKASRRPAWLMANLKVSFPTQLMAAAMDSSVTGAASSCHFTGSWETLGGMTWGCHWAVGSQPSALRPTALSSKPLNITRSNRKRLSSPPSESYQ